MTSDPASRAVSVKKYPNRRFYDATHSRHLTLSEMHDLICAGHDLQITDSQSGADITNVVLTQIILERDADKLAAFMPANILHEIIRTQHQYLGAVVDRFFRQVLDAHRASQDRWAQFLQNTLGVNPLAPPPGAAAPLDWTRFWMGAWMPAPASSAAPARPAPPPAPDDRARETTAADQLAELQRQIAELTKRVEQLSGGETRAPDAPT
ncbi:MAG: polyhydroxyalkanoate synthesis regulator DNA-binding domain-containing protein [Phycisphaerae bacterium]